MQIKKESQRQKTNRKPHSSDKFLFIIVGYFVEFLFLSILLIYSTASTFFIEDFSQFLSNCSSSTRETIRISFFNEYEVLITIYNGACLLGVGWILSYMANIHFSSAKGLQQREESHWNHSYPFPFLILMISIIVFIVETFIIAYLAKGYSSLRILQHCISDSSNYTSSTLTLIIFCAITVIIRFVTSIFFFQELYPALKHQCSRPNRNEENDEDLELDPKRIIEETMENYMINLKFPSKGELKHEEQEGSEGQEKREEQANSAVDIRYPNPSEFLNKNRRKFIGNSKYEEDDRITEKFNESGTSSDKARNFNKQRDFVLSNGMNQAQKKDKPTVQREKQSLQSREKVFSEYFEPKERGSRYFEDSEEAKDKQLDRYKDSNPHRNSSKQSYNQVDKDRRKRIFEAPEANMNMKMKNTMFKK